MLPVLTRPLGSKKAIFALSLFSFTLYELRASAKDPAFAWAKPLIRVAESPGAWAVLAVVFCPVVRTRSAQDFGAALIGGEVAVSADLAESSLCSAFPLAAVSTALAR